MIIQSEIKIGNKYRFVSESKECVVTITENPIENRVGFLEYGAIDDEGNHIVCFNDELFEL